MLPLFGRARKAATAEIPMGTINDEWCIPSDQELYGRTRADKMKLEAVLNSEANKDESISTVSNIAVLDDIPTVGYTTTSVVSAVDDVVCNSESFQYVEPNIGDSDLINVSESEINFSNDTFSIMNNETTIVENVVIDESFPSQYAFKTVLERLVALERKFEDLNIKVTKMEESAQKGNSSDSNASIFVNEFVGFMQEVMKSGLSYQQQVLGIFIDELDGMFDFDFNNFDPLK